jgi:N-(5-amino-5-carboxypentanoyl)-L-cysteinyl-D-valine synthase
LSVERLDALWRGCSRSRLREVESKVFQAELGFLTGHVEMLPIRKWFFAKDLSDRSHWNQCFIIRTRLLDINRLERALDQLVSHHDAFRLRYIESDGAIIQEYSRSMPPPLQAIDIASLDRPLHDVLTDMQGSLDITNGPIARVCYLHEYADDTAKLLFVTHHLVIDTVSWRIIACDLQTLYDGKELGAKASSYRQWAKAVQAYLPSAKENAIWEDVIRRNVTQRSSMCKET